MESVSFKIKKEEESIEIYSNNIFILTASVNASSYVCKINDRNIIISLAGKKVFMDAGYGKRTGSLEGNEYFFGHGTGSVIVKMNKKGHIVKIIRDDNVNIHTSTSCYKI